MPKKSTSKKVVKAAKMAKSVKIAKKTVVKSVAKAAVKSVKVARKTVKKAAKKVMANRAGRPKGTGKYGCDTKVVRVPVHLVEDIHVFIVRKIKSEQKTGK